MEQQITQLYQPLFLYIKKRVNHQEDAEDLTQEVFYKLSKSNSDEVSSVKNWVYTIAKNTIIDYYRKQKNQTEEIDDTLVIEEYNENNAVIELGECVTTYVNQLPEEYRSIMKLSELEGMSQKEVAKQLDINYVTVRSKVQRGRKKLKQIFSDCCAIKQGGKGSIMGYQEKNQCNPSC